MKTDFSTKIVKKGIMKKPTKVWFAEEVIKEDRKTQTLSPRNYSGYGICKEKGWEFE